METAKKNADELIAALQGFGDGDVFSRATNLYISALPDELRAFVHCGAILRWFDKDVLEAVLASKELLDVGCTFTPGAIGSAYQQLQRLTFVEPYPRRGYTFHELTRKSLLRSLWNENRPFYLAVSGAAVNYFALKNDEQRSAYEAGKIKEGELDQGMAVEMLYHAVLTHGSDALDMWHDVMQSLYDSRSLGLHHDMIVALDEHIAGGRLDQSLSATTSLWKAREAFANWEVDLLQKHALPLADSNREEVPVEVIVGALQLLGYDAERRAQYPSARQYFERSLAQRKSLENSAGVVNTLIDLSRVCLAGEDSAGCRQCIDEALQHWVLENRIPLDEDSGLISLPPLKFREPELWSRQELETTLAGEDSEGADRGLDTSSDKERADSNQSLVVYFVPVDDSSVEVTAEPFGSMWPVQVDQAVADIWLIAADLAEFEEEYDRMAACARLSGMIYVDIGNVSGALQAVSLLERIGARALDHELVRFMRDYRHELIQSVAGGADKDTLFQALVGEARALVEQLELDKAREKWNAALSVATELRLDISRAACLVGLAEIEWSVGEVTKAREFFKSAISLYQGLDNLEGFASTLVSLVELECSRREFSDAKDCAQQALAIYRDLGLVLGQFDTFQKMATIYREEGRYDNAFAYHGKALDIAQSHKRTSLVAIVSSSIANLELALGRKAAAEVTYEKAIENAHRSKNLLLKHQILLDKARTLTDLAEYAEANNVLDRILSANVEDQAALSLKGWCLDFLGPGKAQEAIGVREKLIKDAPNEITRHRDLADALERSGNPKKPKRKGDGLSQNSGPLPNHPTSHLWAGYTTSLAISTKPSRLSTMLSPYLPIQRPTNSIWLSCMHRQDS
jgi:tetratricopeptide (TPR) repeat protein